MADIIPLGRPISDNRKWQGASGNRRRREDALAETFVDYPKHGFTHVDAPCHMVQGGWSLGECDVRQLCGEAALIDVSDHYPERGVSAHTLEARGKHVQPGDILILRSNLPLHHDSSDPAYTLRSPWVEASAARWIVARGCRALVIDFPQDRVAREMRDRRVESDEFVEHQILLGANCMHLEHVINLDRIDQDRVFLVGWPLRLPGRADGGPAGPIALTRWGSAAPRIHDLSLPIEPDWRGMAQTRLTLSFAAGDPVQETGVSFSGPSHTHCLAPRLIDPALPAIPDVLGARLAQDALLVDLRDLPAATEIDAALLASRLPPRTGEQAIVLQTGLDARVPYAERRWLDCSPVLSADAAHWLVAQGFRLVATDFEPDRGRRSLGAEPVRAQDLEADAILLGADVVMLKHLANLATLDASRVFLAGTALNLPDGVNAPARVFALQW